jgi:hypothetical protein
VCPVTCRWTRQLISLSIFLWLLCCPAVHTLDVFFIGSSCINPALLEFCVGRQNAIRSTMNNFALSQDIACFRCVHNQVRSHDEREPTSACPSGVVTSHECDSASPVVKQVPQSLPLIPDVANTSARAAASPGVAAGSTPTVDSSVTVRSPNQATQKLSRFGEAFIG